MRPTRLAILVTVLSVLSGPRALAADEEYEVHAIFEASTSRGTVLGAWDFRQAYSVGVLRLNESGQGFGARLTLLPAANSSSTWELSADFVGRLANEGPLYFKPIGGVAVAAPGTLWPPRIRGGAELGLTTILGSIGLEAGLSGTYSFPPSRPFEGEWVVAAGVGILFGFDAPPSVSVASGQDDKDPAWDGRGPRPPPWSSPHAPHEDLTRKPPTPHSAPIAALGGGFSTCDGFKASPQCLQAMSANEGAASTSATAPPATGTTTSTVAPTGGTTTSTVPAAAQGSTAAGLSLRPLGLIGSIGAAMGLRSDEERVREAEYQRLMKESERTLEEFKRQAQEPEADADTARDAKPATSTQVDKKEEEKERGRIYVTYTKLNTRTGLYYSGRTSMVIDFRKPLLPQAWNAVLARDLNHHIDENDDPQAPEFRPAVLDKFDVGTAVNYENRYLDMAYLRIRGREQQLIDSFGGAQSDTGAPYRTENSVRAVTKDNPNGRRFHDAAVAQWGELHPYTGY